jgi:PIN domain nuclease of toxin-antitoxin system
MSAVLLDTNAVIWFMARNRLEPAALEAIAAAQSAGNVFISPISIWEAALALRKRHDQPDLGGRDAAQWFRAVLKVPGFKLANLTRRVALEAAPSACNSRTRRPRRLLSDRNCPHQTRSNRYARSSNAEACSSEAELSARYSMLMRRGGNVTMLIS